MAIVLGLLILAAVGTLGLRAGLWFVCIQVIATVSMVIGWALLAPLCAFGVWTKDNTGKNHFPRAFWLWDNDEDGVTPAWYNPQGTRWRAYLWTAWRNSVNNIRYLVLWKGGPIFRWENSSHTWYYQHGFRQDTGWPVWSAGRI